VSDPLGLSIHSKGDEQAARTIRLLGKHGEDPRPAFRQILEELRVAEDMWFRTHGKGAWPHLAEATREAKQQRGQPDDALVASGALGHSLTARRAPGATRSATKTRMRFGSKVWYGKFHKIGSGTTPRRDPLIPVDSRTRRRMVTDVRDYMLGRTRGRSS